MSTRVAVTILLLAVIAGAVTYSLVCRDQMNRKLPEVRPARKASAPVEDVDYGYPLPDRVLEQLRKDERAGITRRQQIRAHAWSVLAAVTNDTTGYPPWFTWCSREDVLNGKCKDGQTRVSSPANVHSAGAIFAAKNSVTSVYFNPPAAKAFGRFPLSKEGVGLDFASTLKNIATGAEAPLTLDSSSIVVKATWRLVSRSREDTWNLPVWEGPTACTAHPPTCQDPQTEGILSEYFPTVRLNFTNANLTQCSEASYPVTPSAPEQTIPIGNLFHIQLCKDEARWIANREGSEASCEGCKLRAAAGDFLVLESLHVATREIEDWTWQTYWWTTSAQPTADRPDRISLESPWTNYAMKTTLDDSFPDPTKPDYQVANPYMEFRIKDGSRSNCMSCHRRAAYDPAATATNTRVSNAAKVYPGRVPNSYFEGLAKTSFLWTVARQAALAQAAAP